MTGAVCCATPQDADATGSAPRQGRATAILIEMACLLYRDYGAAAYQAFVVVNPLGRVRGIERAIVRRAAFEAALRHRRMTEAEP